jgi:hypothetical protein
VLIVHVYDSYEPLKPDSDNPEISHTKLHEIVNISFSHTQTKEFFKRRRKKKSTLASTFHIHLFHATAR